MANTKFVMQTWGVEIHTRKTDKDSYTQSGASVESDGKNEPMSGLPALEHYLGRQLTGNELSLLKAKGYIEV